MDNVPVHSNLMVNSAKEALAIPSGRINLGVCEHCGFISNVDYDPQMANYSEIYEDQQRFSPTFNSFSDELIKQLIEKHNLFGKRVLEIGCGKGDFLLRLCELGNNLGIGIDPAVVPERMQTGRTIVGFIQDYYSEHYLDLKGDVVICRHTLEHIYDTHSFIHTIRRGIGDEDTLVFIEVPESLRVLRESAFWDIYYEHCSYFSPGSLARLFRHADFEITDLWLEFDDQYLLLEARPTKQTLGTELFLEESVDQLLSEVDYFTRHIQEQLELWNGRIDQYQRQNKKIAIWGSGSKCVAFITTLQVHDAIHTIVDINPHRAGKFIPGVGKPIFSPKELKVVKPDVVIVMNPIYQHEIRRDLHEMGLAPLVLSL